MGTLRRVLNKIRTRVLQFHCLSGKKNIYFCLFYFRTFRTLPHNAIIKGINYCSILASSTQLVSLCKLATSQRLRIKNVITCNLYIHVHRPKLQTRICKLEQKNGNLARIYFFFTRVKNATLLRTMILYRFITIRFFCSSFFSG